MKKEIYAALTTLLLYGCSAQPPVDMWRYESIESLASYTDAYLKGKDVVAQYALEQSIHKAKQSAKLDTLAKVYLSECALNRAFGDEKGCKEYLHVNEIESNNYTYNYYRFINGDIGEVDTDGLPKQYTEFARLLQKGERKKAEELLVRLQPVSSVFVAASVMKEHLSNQTRQKLVEIASHYGYKRAVLFWLQEWMHHTQDSAQKAKIAQKIKLLED